MLPLTDPRWSTLKSNYGSGAQVVELLALARNGDLNDAGYEELFQSLCHQYTLSEAAYAALPHLLEIAQAVPQLREEFLLLAGWCYACSALPNAPALPSDLSAAWRSVPVRAIPMTAEVLQEKIPSQEQFRALTSSLAAYNGHFSLAFVLESLDVEVECPQCGNFIDPMASSLNMLSDNP